MMKRWATPSSWYRALMGSAGLSVAVHVVLIGGAIIATSIPDGSRETPEMNVIARFLAPPDRVGGQQGGREQVKYVAMSDAHAVVTGAITKRIEDVKTEPEKPQPGIDPV